jgi:hypothetical protein
VKVRFDYLTVAQARLAFCRFFDAPPPPRLDALRALTPADFSLVRRRGAVAGITGSEALVRLLAAECAGRIGGRIPVGFASRWDKICF